MQQCNAVTDQPKLQGVMAQQPRWTTRVVQLLSQHSSPHPCAQLPCFTSSQTVGCSFYDDAIQFMQPGFVRLLGAHPHLHSGQAKTPCCAGECLQVGWRQLVQGMPSLVLDPPPTPTCNSPGNVCGTREEHMLMMVQLLECRIQAGLVAQPQQLLGAAG